MSRGWNRFQKWTIAISILAIISAVLITVFVPEVRAWLHLGNQTRFAVSGTVMDDETKQGLSGAEITVVGRSESCRSEDNGNFRLQIKENTDGSEPIRLLVNKEGYEVLDRSVSVPSPELILPLKKIR